MSATKTMVIWLSDPRHWLDLLQIVWINILLSGDNAIVVALASSKLPQTQRRAAIFIGTVWAVAVLVVLTLFAAYLLKQPYLRLAGGLALLYVATTLLRPNREYRSGVSGSSSMFSAALSIVVANTAMSLDNVLGVAAVANGHWVLLVIGLGFSVPLIICGSQRVAQALTRRPVLVVPGAAYLGYLAGDLGVSDPMWMQMGVTVWAQHVIPILTVVSVFLAAGLLSRRWTPKRTE